MRGRAPCQAAVRKDTSCGAPGKPGRERVASVLRKLDLRDRVHAVIFAYESGVVDPG